MPKKPDIPLPMFDTLDSLEHLLAPAPAYVDDSDFAITREFLLAYRGSPDTFHSYRRDVDRFLQWVYLAKRLRLGEGAFRWYPVFSKS